MGNGDITKITRANNVSQSLRTTIPMSVTRQFGLKEGGELRWQIKAENNELIVLVTPIKV